MTIASDLRHALRMLLRSPGFAAVTIVTLALGIGANTAIFSVVNAAILQPLPYPRSDRLVFISSQFPQQGFEQFWISTPEFVEFRERTRAFSSVGAFVGAPANLTAPDHPRRVIGARVSADLFTTLGVAPLAGRTFVESETRPNGPQVAVVSYELWQSAFGGDRTLVGRSVDINGVPRTIVGIMPAGFDVMDRHMEVWVPLVVDPANPGNRGGHSLYLIGRLADGATMESAKAELGTLLAAWPGSLGATAGTPGGTHTPSKDQHPFRYDMLQDQIVGGAKRAVIVLQGAVLLVLLIACANVASLLLARAESRHKEFAVRSALGAGRAALVMPFMAEACLLSLGGGILGVALGVFGVRTLIAAFPDSLPRSAEIGLNLGVLVFAVLVALACALLVGLAPLLHLSPDVTAEALKESGQRTTTGAARNRIRRVLVAGEVALAVALVISAGLLIRTVVNLSRVDTGFARERLVTFGVSLPPATYASGPEILSFYDRLIGRLSQLPGVTAVGGMTGLPPTRQVNANDTDIEGYTAPPNGPFENVDYYQTVTADYIRTMGIPVIEGRAFEPADATASTGVALINDTMARTFFKGQSPVGRRVRPSGGPNPPWYTIVGVVKDVKQGGVDQKTGTELYFNLEQTAHLRPTATPGTLNIAMRSSASPEALASAIQQTVVGLDPTLPIVRLRSMDDVFTEAIGRPRLLADLLGAFAGLALALAVVGIYGVLSFMVTERRREIGIRMALGAERAAVLRMVLSQGLRLTLIGLAGGVGVALALNRLLASLLFGVAPTDPITIAAVVTLITAVSLIGCYLPARRATRVDPMVALRDD
jgi:predicted permease